jgi:hypothetical protein
VKTLHRVTRLFRHLRSALEAEFGFSLTFDDLAELLDERRSTLGNWSNGDGFPSAETLLRMLELVPVRSRQTIFEAGPCCRPCPTLDDARLSHDPIAVSQLRRLLLGRGTVLVEGDQDHVVTYTVTALGHSYLRLHQAIQRVRGVDSHVPDWFVPVPGVVYLQHDVAPAEVRDTAKKTIADIHPGRTALVIFNRIGDVPEIWDFISTAAKNVLVILGEVSRPEALRRTRAVPPPIHVVRVRLEPGKSERIHVQLHRV